jgi:hypothetical protein
MKTLTPLLLALAWTAVAGATNPASLGYTEGGTVLGPGNDVCWGEETHNHDGSFENGYAWRYGGDVPPYYGAFGEGLETVYPGYIGCAKIWATTLPGYYSGQTCDIYIWDGGVTSPPGSVLSMDPGVVLENVPNWPTVGENDVFIPGCVVQGEYTIGYWGNWPGVSEAYYVGADLNGPGGHPWTNIAPGIGYPTGWNDPSFIWGPTQSLGFGSVYSWNSPVDSRTWGEVKTLFR